LAKHHFSPSFRGVFAVSPVLRVCAFVLIPSFADFSRRMFKRIPKGYQAGSAGGLLFALVLAFGTVSSPFPCLANQRAPKIERSLLAPIRLVERAGLSVRWVGPSRRSNRLACPCWRARARQIGRCPTVAKPGRTAQRFRLACASLPVCQSARTGKAAP
jgi:hypothetical protein